MDKSNQALIKELHEINGNLSSIAHSLDKIAKGVGNNSATNSKSINRSLTRIAASLYSSKLPRKTLVSNLASLAQAIKTRKTATKNSKVAHR